MRMKNLQCYGFERKIGKTPCGGKYAETYYYKDEGIACEKAEATHCIIFEKKRNGKTLNVIRCSL